MTRRSCFLISFSVASETLMSVIARYAAHRFKFKGWLAEPAGRPWGRDSPNATSLCLGIRALRVLYHHSLMGRRSRTQLMLMRESAGSEYVCMASLSVYSRISNPKSAILESPRWPLHLPSEIFGTFGAVSVPVVYGNRANRRPASSDAWVNKNRTSFFVCRSTASGPTVPMGCVRLSVVSLWPEKSLSEPRALDSKCHPTIHSTGAEAPAVAKSRLLACQPG